MGGNNKRRKEKEKQKNADRIAGENFLEFKYSSYVRADQPKNLVVVRRLGSTGEFVKDHRAEKRVVRKGVTVKPEVLREAFIVQNFQFILRPEAFYEQQQSSLPRASEGISAGEERSMLVAQGLMDDFPLGARKSPHQILSEALGSFGTKIHWSHVVAVATRLDVDDIKCPICLENPTAPRVTPCGHIFCFHCILRAMNAQKKLGLAGAINGATATPTRNRPSATSANALGSASDYGARPRTCPLCSCAIDLQSLRPCFIDPIEPLTESIVKDQPMQQFSLAGRNFLSPIVVPADAQEEEGGDTLAVVAATLYHQPQYIPTYGTPAARFSRYAFATAKLLQSLFQTELTDIERELRLLTESRPNPQDPLDEGEEYQQNALQGVYRHLASYGYSTLITSGCEVQTVASLRHQKSLMSAAIARGASEEILAQAFPTLPSSASTTPSGLGGRQSGSPTPLGSNAPVFPSTPAKETPSGLTSFSPLPTGSSSMPPRQPSSSNFTPFVPNSSFTTSPAPQKQVTLAPSASSGASSLVWSYRLSDGQHVYLHPINVRMLMKQAELDAEREGGQSDAAITAKTENDELAIASKLPQHLNVRVLDLEHFTQQPSRISKVFAQVPPHAAFVEAFVDLTPIVSNEVTLIFKPQIMERLKDIHRKKRKAELEACNDNDDEGGGWGGGSTAYSGSKASGGSRRGHSYGREGSAAVISSVASSTDVGVLSSLQQYLEEEEEDEEGWYEGEEYEEDYYNDKDEDYADYEQQSKVARTAAPTVLTSLTSAAVAEAAAAHEKEAATVIVNSMMGARNGSAATHSSGNGGAAGAASWVDAHTTADDYAVYTQQQQKELKHPDEVKNNGCAQSAHSTPLNDKKAQHNNNKNSASGSANTNNAQPNQDRTNPPNDINYSYYEDDEEEDYDIGHSEEEDAFGGMRMKHRHANINSGGGGGRRESRKPATVAAPSTNGASKKSKHPSSAPTSASSTQPVNKHSASQTVKEQRTPPPAPPENMAAILAALGDLTEEEQMWLLQEEENSRKSREEVVFDTPALNEQWGNNGEQNQESSHPSTTVSTSWQSKPKHFDASAFPDLGSGSGGANATSGGKTSQGGWGSGGKSVKDALLTPPVRPQVPSAAPPPDKFMALPVAEELSNKNGSKKKKK